MIRFYDLDTRRVFNGSKPYVFELGTGTSTGLWLSETVIVVSDSPELTFSFPNDSLFHIADLGDPEEIELNGHLYKDLDSIKTQSISMEGTQTENNLYLYRLNVIFMSGTEGEIHDFLNISGDETEEFEFSVDVYGEDERLPIDVSNMGFEMPKQFQKAIYDSNVREESEDHILLNRKWKELLIEYWNVLANKGSYRSLINSLKFFEYGDLVKIYEYWKYVDNFDNTLLVGRDLEQILDKDILNHLDVLTKTTYIGLNMLVNKISEGGYEDIPEGTLDLYTDKFIPEPVPELEFLSTKWSIEDLALKMTLLANYFSTYFMPIHLDLIHSSIDRMVFTNCIKILHNVRRKRQDHWDDCGVIDCNLTYQKDYWIGNTHAYNYPGIPPTVGGTREGETVLRNTDTPTYWGDLIRIGMDPLVENNITFSDTDFDDTKQFLNQYFGGVGVVVPIHCECNEPHGFFKCVNILVYKNIEGSNYTQVSNYVSYTPVYTDTLDFNLLFTGSGKYLIRLQLVDSDSSTRVGSWTINVHGRIGNSISIKKFRKIDYTTVDSSKEFDDWFYDNLDFNSFMFTEPFAGQIKYKQWLMPTQGCDIEGIGMNRIVLIDCGTGPDFRTVNITCEGMGDFSETFYIDIVDSEETYPIIEHLKGQYYHYWWKVLKRPVAHNRNGNLEITDEYRYYICGVRKYFDIDGDSTEQNLISETYRAWNIDGDEPELEDHDNIIVRVSHRTNPGQNRGYLVVTAPIGTKITIDGGQTHYTYDPTTTIPMIKERYRLSIEYLAYGHLFKKDITVGDMICELGTDRYIVVPQKENGYTTMNETRFFPIFHTLEDIGTSIRLSDTAVCMPDFRWVDKQVEGTRWEFINATTGEIFYSKSFSEYDNSGDPLYIEEPFIGKFDYRNVLTKGYYDIVLHYTMGGTEQTETVLSAFRIE